jgi:uroporphyrinogen III methyltransferase/synthase
MIQPLPRDHTSAAPPSDRGKVYLVGAGPGAITYLTTQAHDRIRQAEVLVYDALIDPSLLAIAPPHCLRLETGKRGGQTSIEQSEIDRLLVRYCRQGKQVVRLKSGDPFIFGRSASELRALVEAGCAFEVVPGLSSALAAPLLAGIPLTDPVLSRTFAVCSAHDPDALNWEALAQIDTLVVLMAGRTLPVVVQQLLRHGRASTTAIAAIRAAGHPQQDIWIGSLESIVVQTAGIRLSPVVLVVGEVVHLRDYWPNPGHDGHNAPSPQSGDQEQAMLPLSGKNVLVTRSASQADTFVDLLTAAGATALEMPALEIGPPSSWAEFDQAITHLHTFHWLVLTSSNGVDALFERLAASDRDARALQGLKIAVVGQKTAHALDQRGIRPDFIPPNFVADSLATTLPDPLEGRQILFPRVESGGRDVLIQALGDRGATVVPVAAYQSCCPDQIDPAALTALDQRTVDIITFASSKTVRHFGQLLNQATTDRDQGSTTPAGDRLNAAAANLLQGVCIASIGPQTSETCREWFKRVDVEAREYTLEGLTTALVAWVNECPKP